MHLINKKLICLAFVLSCCLATHAQNRAGVYLELRGNIDALGNISLSAPGRSGKTDTLVNYAQIKAVIDLREPVKVLNKLAEAGWKLISVAYVNGAQDRDRPNTPFLLYYLFKENQVAH